VAGIGVSAAEMGPRQGVGADTVLPGPRQGVDKDGVAELLCWQAGSGLRPAAEVPAKLLVADSWLLEHGTARGLDLHRARFLAGCEAVDGIESAELPAFWSALLDRLPRNGMLFPRAELVATGAGNRLRLRLRPAPPRTGEIVVWAPGETDSREAPRRKGPDIDRLATLRDRAVAHGATEALLVTNSGFVLEGATSSLLWWEGDILCLPDPSLRVLPSVTAELISRAAHARGITVRRRRRRLADLAGREAWLANALHGIRPVVGWLGSTVSPAVPVRAAGWRQWWQDCAQALPTPTRSPLESSVPSLLAAPVKSLLYRPNPENAETVDS
jgi:branched-subunit amino acid aminotransferase/4-amino-4-deoxychorismate lyase